jgi:hypothetical protein
LPSQGKNIQSSVEVAVDMQKTARAIKDPLGQGHFLPMSTPAARLRCVGRIHFDQLPASFFREASIIEQRTPTTPRPLCFWRDNGCEAFG